jgi:hypothetical protein
VEWTAVRPPVDVTRHGRPQRPRRERIGRAAGRAGPLITPTFDIDGTIVKDFDEKRLAEVLGHRAAR